MKQQSDLAEVKIFRFNPALDMKPRFDTFQVPYKGLTVLNVLNYIFENLDASLAFRFGCLGKGSARCGACTVMVNRSPALSCRKFAEKKMIIEAHPRYGIVKDLVSDFNEKRELPNDLKTQVTISVDNEKCIGCGDCVKFCPGGVYEMAKIDGKLKANPTFKNGCCGASCLQCVRYCWKDAIRVTTD